MVVVSVSKGIVNEHIFMQSLKYRLQDYFRQEWHSTMKSERFRMHRELKAEIVPGNCTGFLQLKMLGGSFIEYGCNMNEVTNNRGYATD